VNSSIVKRSAGDELRKFPNYVKWWVTRSLKGKFQICVCVL